MNAGLVVELKLESERALPEASDSQQELLRHAQECIEHFLQPLIKIGTTLPLDDCARLDVTAVGMPTTEELLTLRDMVRRLGANSWAWDLPEFARRLKQDPNL